jgi:hypothetical protein
MANWLVSQSSEELVRASVIVGLRAIGDEVPQMVFYYLQTEHGIMPDDIANDPVRLGKGLKAVFGDLGARLVIESILRDAANHPSYPSRYHHFMEGLKTYNARLFST